MASVTGKVWMARQVFETWWIRIPPGFEETFVEPEQYWHAYDGWRSVSLTSSIVLEDGRPVPAEQLARQALPLIDGEPVEELPEGLTGRAAIVWTTPPAIASRALAGVLVTDGRLLVATITSDDLRWAREVWTSIAFRPTPHAHASRHRS